MQMKNPADELQKITLSGDDWFIHDDPNGEGIASGLCEAELSGSGWIRATVPGNIQADLESAHLLKPTWYGEGDPLLWDVARKDWWYRKDFTVPESFQDKRAVIIFDGADFECEVWLNGDRLGSHAGMFRRFWYDITGAIRPGQKNRLAVRIARMPEELLPFLKNSDGKMSGAETEFFFVYANNKIRRVLKDLKSPANCSYDWGTNIYTLGIWKDVRIEASRTARIEWAHVQTELKDDYSKAIVHAMLDVDSLSGVKTEVAFTVKGPDGQTVTAITNSALKNGRNTVTARIELPNPSLWWPAGYGGQPLYELESTLKDTGSGVVLDTKTVRFGVREIRWEQVEGAPPDFLNPYRLVLNGKTIRTMGSNLVSPDLLFGRNAKRGPWFIHVAKFSGMNTLRLHGGGVVLPENMYDLADELGVMISHEFPVANCVQESDPVFLENLEATCRNIIRQVRNHPCIIEYSGGNELNWKATDDYAALHVMERVTAGEDNRLFRATCPMQGSRHSPWHYDRKITYTHYDNENLNDNFEQNRLMRYGEFGTQSPANIEVWHRDIPPASQWPIDGVDDPVLIRKNVVQAVFSDEFWLTREIVEDLFGLSNSLEMLIKAGQFIGAEGLRYTMDAMRRRGARLGGFTNWDYNEPWPNGAGSYIVDYDGRTLMNFDFFKQALAPVCLNIKQTEILYDPDEGLTVEFWLVSDAPQPVQDLRWRWLARDRRGDVFAREQGDFAIKPLETINLGKVTLKPPAKTAFGPLFLELQIVDSNGQILAERMHIFGRSGVHGALSGLLKNHAPDRDDDEPGSLNNLDNPANPLNLAYAGNGAVITASSGAECADFDPLEGLIDGKYGPTRIWNGTQPKSWFQIDLGKVAVVGRFKLGRDRHGHLKDRTLDYLKIETSLDGQNWQTAFEAHRLAALAGDCQPPSHEGAWLPIVKQLAEYLDYRPTWTMEVFTQPLRARHVRTTIAPKPGRTKYAALDEFEVYPPDDTIAGSFPRFIFTDANELARPVKRATLNVTAKSARLEGDQEILELAVENRGTMTTLFCEPHPMLNYRTDLLIENKNVCIPPSELRTITIRGPRNPAQGLTLAQTGWRLASWNADDVIIAPSDDVLLAFGRQDAMTREFMGYDKSSTPALNVETTVTGSRPDAFEIPYLLDQLGVLRIEFPVPDRWAGRAARLRIHTADRSRMPVNVRVSINGQTFMKELPGGLGIQDQNPAHLAYPATMEIAFPAGVLHTGPNTMEIRVSGGWMSWDALDMVAL